MAPASLHESHLLVLEVGDGLLKKRWRWHEVGIEDREEFPLRRADPRFQGAGLEPYALRTMNLDDVHPFTPESLHQSLGDELRLVRGVVQNLDFKAVTRPIERARGLD